MKKSAEESLDGPQAYDKLKDGSQAWIMVLLGSI